MVRKLTLALIILSIHSLFAQTEIYVNNDNKTFIVFGEEPIDINTNWQKFKAEIHGKSVSFQTIVPRTTPTSALIQFADSTFSVMLVYKADMNSSEYFIDLTPKTTKTVVKEEKIEPVIEKGEIGALNLKDEVKKTTLDSDMKEKLIRFGKVESDQKYSDIGIYDKAYLITLDAIRNDEKATYIRLKFQNKSSYVYSIKSVNFQYLEKGKGNSVSGVDTKGDKECVGYNNVNEIPAKSTEILSYAIPIYSTSSKGELHILLRDHNGTRSIDLTIPISRILKADLF